MEAAFAVWYGLACIHEINYSSVFKKEIELSNCEQEMEEALMHIITKWESQSNLWLQLHDILEKARTMETV